MLMIVHLCPVTFCDALEHNTSVCVCVCVCLCMCGVCGRTEGEGSTAPREMGSCVHHMFCPSCFSFGQQGQTWGGFLA